jgi:hypothetical protein
MHPLLRPQGRPAKTLSGGAIQHRAGKARKPREHKCRHLGGNIGPVPRHDVVLLRADRRLTIEVKGEAPVEVPLP